MPRGATEVRGPWCYPGRHRGQMFHLCCRPGSALYLKRGSTTAHIPSKVQTLALTVASKKGHDFDLSKSSNSQQHKFTLGNTHTKGCSYLGSTIPSTGLSDMAADELKQKVSEGFYTLKRTIPYHFPIRSRRRILDCDINPIVFYGCEVWDPSSNQDLMALNPSPIETLQQ